jgi:hypothetical protein
MAVVAFAALADAAIPPKLLASAPISIEPMEAAAGAGYVFWSDSHNNLNRMTADLTQSEVLPWPSNVCEIYGLAMDRSGYLYASDGWAPSDCDSRLLHKLTTSGAVISSLCDYAGTGGIGFGGDFVVSRQGDFFAAGRDPGLRRFTANGTLAGYWGPLGSGPGQTGNVSMGIGMDEDEQIYLLDSGNRRVQVFDRDGAFLRMWGISWSDGRIAVDRDGHVFVGDPRKKEVHVYDLSGAELGKWGTVEPLRVIVDEGGNIYVIGPDRIQKFERLSTPEPPDIPLAEPAVLLHIVPAEPGMACANTPAEYDDIVTHADAVSPEGTPYYVYFLASPRTLDEGYTGITGIQATLTYDHGEAPASGIAVWSWNHCAEMEFAQDGWPQSGTGNTITWSKSTCRQELLVPAGYLYIGAYSPAAMAVTGYSSTGLVKIANCAGAERVVEAGRQGWISIGGATYAGKVGTAGCNPLVESCTAPVAVRSVTWGHIKTLYD